MLFLSPFADFSSRANIAMTIDIDKTAGANLEGSMNDNNATAPANTPTATAMPIIVPLTSLAFLVATTINDTRADNADTATIPLTKFSVLTIPRRTETPANTPIAKDMVRSVKDIFAICSLGAKFVIATKAAIIAVKPARPMAALPMSSKDMLANNLAAIAREVIAIETCIKVVPIAETFPFPISFVAAIRPAINAVNPAKPTPAFFISSHEIVAISLAATARSKKETESFPRNAGTLSMSFPASFVAAIKPITTADKPARPMAALPMSSNSIVATNLAATARSTKDTASFPKKAGALSTSFPNFVTAISPATTPPKTTRAAPAFTRPSVSIVLIIFAAADRSKKDPAKEIRRTFNFIL